MMITFPFLEFSSSDYSLRIFFPESFQNILPRILPEYSQFECGSVIRVTSKCDWIGGRKSQLIYYPVRLRWKELITLKERER